ncbi:MAG: aminotransferase class I/II-fold pyridoxal phosphate-dependent enzyme [Thermodesulfovibrionales bacterium]
MKASVRKAIKKINSGPCEDCAFLKRLFESKFGLSPENMLFANSLKELIYLIPDILKPKRVLIVGPALNIYEEASQAAGAEVSYINAMETDGLSLMRENLNDKDLVFLATPNRIAGKMIPREKIIEAIAVMKSAGPHFVIDESLIDFAGSYDHLNGRLHNGNLTVLRTTAFFYGVPGLELAYAVSSPDIINLYRKNKHWEINPLTAQAAATAFKDSTYIKASKQYMLREKKMIIRRLSKIEWIKIYDTDSNIILIKINKNSDEVTQRLRIAGLDIRDCGEINGLDSSYLRISVMKHENNLKLISVFNSLELSRQP